MAAPRRRPPHVPTAALVGPALACGCVVGTGAAQAAGSAAIAAIAAAAAALVRAGEDRQAGGEAGGRRRVLVVAAALALGVAAAGAEAGRAHAVWPGAGGPGAGPALLGGDVLPFTRDGRVRLRVRWSRGTGEAARDGDARAADRGTRVTLWLPRGVRAPAPGTPVTVLAAPPERQGAAGRALEAPRPAGAPGGGPTAALGRAAAHVRRVGGAALDGALPHPESLLARGLVFGGGPRHHALRTAGAGHLLAVSGLHVGLVAVAAVGLLRAVGLRGRRWAAAAGPAAVVYCAAAGAPPSARRATWMVCAAGAAAVCGRRRASWGVLGTAAGITAWLDPTAPATPGWQLSFAAVAGILCRPRRPLDDGGPGLRAPRPRPTRARRAWGRARDAVSVSTGAWLGAAPVGAAWFGTVHPWGWAVTAGLLPVAAAALPLSLLTAAAWAVPGADGHPAAWGLARAAQGALHLLAAGGATAGALPALEPHTPGPVWPVTAAHAALLWARARGAPARVHAAWAAVAATAWMHALLPG